MGEVKGLDPELEASSIFPTLKGSVRIKKYRSFCWVLDTMGDKGCDAMPLEACLLALCSGKHSLADLTYILMGMMRWDRQGAESFLSKTLEKFPSHFDWRDRPGSSRGRYNPEEFLYGLVRSPMVAQGRFDTPAEADIILTHFCNFRCIYCFNSSGRPGVGELSTAEWLEVVDQLRQLGVLKCTVSGGEPTLHPGFEPIVRRLVESDIVPYICSNGSRVDDRLVGLFLELGIPYIQISLDAASAATHDRLTAVDGTFLTVIGAIRRLIAAGIAVYVKAVMTPLNWQEAEGLIDLCHGLGVQRLILDRFDLSNAGRGNERLFLTRSQERALEAMVERKRAALGDDMTLGAVTMSRCWTCKDDIISCGALRTGVAILPNGSISLCEKLIDVPELTAGNVREQPLAEIWSSPRATAIITPPAGSVAAVCRDCEHFTTCRTGCFALTLLVSDNPYAPDPRCWKADYARNPYVNGYMD